MHQVSRPEPNVVSVLGADYYVQWECMGVGMSFFMPTTATASMVLKAIDHSVTTLGIRVVAHNRTEYGRYGVRVWRIS